jgi:hypothetical protein
MKIDIGPYKNWIGPYQIVDAIFFWQDKYSDCMRWDYRLSSWLGEKLSESLVGDICRWIYNKRKRKVKVHIDDYDTWSMDHTLALIIVPMLKQLKSTNHGCPITLPEDVPHIGKGEENDWGSDSKAEERWNWIMDEMIWAFEQIETDKDYDPPYLNEDGTYDIEEKNKYEDRINNGFILFGKYFRNLWD